MNFSIVFFLQPSFFTMQSQPWCARFRLMSNSKEFPPLEEIQSWDWEAILKQTHHGIVHQFISSLLRSTQSYYVEKNVDTLLNAKLAWLVECQESAEEKRRQQCESDRQAMSSVSTTYLEWRKSMQPVREFCQAILDRIDVCEYSSLSRYNWNTKRVFPRVQSRADELLSIQMETQTLSLTCYLCHHAKPAVILTNTYPRPRTAGFTRVSTICPIILCFDCARFFCAQGCDMYQQGISAAFPIPRHEAVVPCLEAWRHLVDDATGARPINLVADVYMLHREPLAQTEDWKLVHQHLLDFLTSNLLTRPYFDWRYESRQVDIRTAAMKFASSTQGEFIEAPLSIQMLVVRLIHRYHSNRITHEQVEHLFHLAIFATLAKILQALDREQLLRLLDIFLEHSFDTRYHILQRGTLHPISVRCSALWSALGTKSTPLQMELHDHPLLCHHTFSAMLHVMLRRLQEQGFYTGFKPQNLIKMLSAGQVFDQVNPFRDLPVWPGRTWRFNQWESFSRCVESVWVGIDAAHNHHEAIPEFFLNLGPYSCPDPTICSCGYELLPSNRTYSSLTEAVAVIRERRQHFAEVYGSKYPSRQSYHTPLHAYVAQMMFAHETEELKTDESLEDQIGLKLIRDHGKRGDIHKPNMLRNLKVCMASYQQVRQTQPDYGHGVDERIPRSLAYKVACALARKDRLPLSLDDATPLSFFRQDAKFFF